MAIETYTGVKFDLVPGCFVAESEDAHQFVKDLRKGHEIFELPNDLAVVHTQDVPIRNLPLHPGSWAQYCLDVFDGDDRVLLWFIDPPKDSPPLTTSEHYHPSPDDQGRPGIEEDYFFLNGLINLSVGINPDDKTDITKFGSLSNPPKERILPKEWHQAQTVRGPITVAVRMYNAAFYPLDQQHIRR